MTTRTFSTVQSYFVNAPVSRVFSALTDPKVVREWFLADAHLDPTPGGDDSFGWTGGHHHSGHVLTFLRGQQLALSGTNRVGRATLTTRVTLSLQRRGTGTVLRLRHSGDPRRDPWIRVFGGTQAGWGYFLTNLKSVLEHGHDLRSPNDG